MKLAYLCWDHPLQEVHEPSGVAFLAEVEVHAVSERLQKQD